MTSLETRMINIQSEVSSLKVRADSAETNFKEMYTGLQFANAEVEDLKTQSRNNQQGILSLKELFSIRRSTTAERIYNFLAFLNVQSQLLKTQAKCCTVSWKEILILKGLVVSSFREFITSEGKRKAPRAPSSHVSLDILIRNGSLRLLWKHRMRLMLKCMQIYLRRYKKIGKSNGHG